MNVWGARIHAPNLNRALAAWLLNAGFMGRDERRFFEGAVTRDQIVVDVGANQGVFTLLFSRLVGPRGRVIALEPAPALFEALDENCRVNNAHNVTRLRTAAGETRSRGTLRCSRLNSGDNRLTDSLKGPSFPVEVMPLDDILPTEQVHFVKIDVQGYESQVVRGMQAIMDRSPDIKVFFEYWPAGLAHAGRAPTDLFELFIDRGFSLFELSRSGFRTFDWQRAARSRKPRSWSWTNVLAVRE